MVTQFRKHHLTDLEFSELLFGEQPEACVAEHLETCDHCRREFEAVGGSLSSFRHLSTVWAQASAPAKVAVPSAWTRRLASVPSWGTGLAVTTAAGILAFVLSPSSAPAPRPAPAVATAAPASTDLAADNRLMLSIDNELSYNAPVDGHHGASRHSLSPTPGSIHDTTADAILD